MGLSTGDPALHLEWRGAAGIRATTKHPILRPLQGTLKSILGPGPSATTWPDPVAPCPKPPGRNGPKGCGRRLALRLWLVVSHPLLGVQCREALVPQWLGAWWTKLSPLYSCLVNRGPLETAGTARD